MPGEKSTVAVRDEGAGIPEDVQPRIFEPFYTTKDSRSASGMGLGLAICRNLAASFGGELSFHTGQGCGTTFTVTIPWM